MQRELDEWEGRIPKASRQGLPVDPETLRRLRTLGYVGR
jgi:hypothetical protein